MRVRDEILWEVKSGTERKSHQKVRKTKDIKERDGG